MMISINRDEEQDGGISKEIKMLNVMWCLLNIFTSESRLKFSPSVTIAN